MPCRFGLWKIQSRLYGYLFIILDTLWRLKINGSQEGGGAQLAPYPDRPGEPDCLYYLRTGLCGYGINCRYNHPAYVSQVIKHLDLHFGSSELSFI